MKRKLLLTALVFKMLSVGAQDGKVIQQLIYHHTDSFILAASKRDTGFATLQKQTEVRSIIYLSDGLKIKGYLVQPKEPGIYPCILICRAGNAFLSPFDAADVAQMQRYASWGYVVIGTQYRGAFGAEGKDEFGGDDIHDVLNAARAFGDIRNADTSRIGLYGVSRGGMMVYLALKKSARFKAAVVVSGEANIFTHLALRPDAATLEEKVYATHIPGYAINKEAELKKRSAVFWADSLHKTTPILIMQGSADWRVNTEEVLELVNKFYTAHQPVKFILYPGAPHGLIGENRTEINNNIKSWFDDYLKNNKPLPNMEKHGR